MEEQPICAATTAAAVGVIGVKVQSRTVSMYMLIASFSEHSYRSVVF